MQVFISDLHLTDGTSGTTIREGAFKLLNDNLKKLIADVKASGSTVTELKVVLLGDIFDVIRSTKWLDSNLNPSSVKPWDKKGTAQQEMVDNIISGILIRNNKSIDYLKNLSQLSQKFDMQYIIGNHDWLINRYDTAKNRVADALGIAVPAGGFKESIYEKDYKTFALHGDKYDKANYMNNNRDNSSIGDAIVIELLNKLPQEAKNELDILVAGKKVSAGERDQIVDKLKELDNVRPLLEVFPWMITVSNNATKNARQAIKTAEHTCIDGFFKAARNISWLAMIGRYGIKLQFSRYIPTFLLDILAIPVLGWQCIRPVRYEKKAWAEPKMRSGEAKYVIYGHTHVHETVPMDQVRLDPNSVEDKIYFNTGTWRQTWNKAVFDTSSGEYIGWKVLTYIAFYKEGENKDYSFEVWNGALG